MRACLVPVLWLVCLCALLADEVVLKNGSAFEGRIVEETKDRISIDIGSGILKFEKSTVARITRDAEAPADPAPEPMGPSGIPQALEGELVANVGPGGVTRKELADRVYGYTRGDSGLDDLSPMEAQVYLDPLVDDELLFQGAIADGVFDDPAVRRRLCEVQLSAQGVDTRLVGGSDADLKAWYNAHRDELIEAKRLFVRGAKIEDFATFTTDWDLERFRDHVARLKAAGPNDKVWDAEGWVGRDEEFMGPRTYTMLKNVRKGDWSNDIVCDDQCVWVFKVFEREDAEAPPPFEKCRDRVRMLMAAEVAKAVEAGTTEETFRAALAAGLHRNSYLRAFVIETYVTKRKASRADLLTEMRERFRVTVLLDE